jgi:hypothetical protein
MALGTQEDVQAAVAESALFSRQLGQTMSENLVSRSARPVTNSLAIGHDQMARPALAYLVRLDEMSDSLALGGGRYHFFNGRSFSAPAWRPPKAA